MSMRWRRRSSRWRKSCLLSLARIDAVEGEGGAWMRREIKLLDKRFGQRVLTVTVMAYTTERFYDDV